MSQLADRSAAIDLLDKPAFGLDVVEERLYVPALYLPESEIVESCRIGGPLLSLQFGGRCKPLLRIETLTDYIDYPGKLQIVEKNLIEGVDILRVCTGAKEKICYTQAL